MPGMNAIPAKISEQVAPGSFLQGRIELRNQVAKFLEQRDELAEVSNPAVDVSFIKGIIDARNQVASFIKSHNELDSIVLKQIQPCVPD